MKSFQVLIVGGGIVGLTAALGMAQRGYTVAVIDANSFEVDTSHKDSRVYAMNQASQIFLDQLGVWQLLDKTRLSPYNKMYVWDQASKAHINFDARSIAASRLGTIVEESILKQALLDQIVKHPNINLFNDCVINEVHPAPSSIKISSQSQSWEGELLMIADGANSPTRQKLYIPLTSWPYQQNALVATVAVEKEHQQTAYQVFNPDGPLAFLPLADSHQCSIVWSTNPSRTKELMALSNDEFNEELTDAFAQKLGRVEVLSVRHQFPLAMRHVHQYSGSRWLLLGDAAHTVHPLAGLGLNIGLADVSAWLGYLDAANGNLLSKKALGAYQRDRKHAVWQVIALMEGFKRLFGYSWQPLVTFRGLGLNACNQLPFLKRLFIQHARGVDNSL